MVVGLCAALTAAYLCLGIAPGRLHGWAEEKLARLTGRSVIFRKAVYLPFYGLTLYGLEVSRPDGTEFFSARSLTVDIRLWRFFAGKEIILSKLRLEGPSYEHWLDGPVPSAEGPPAVTRLTGQIAIPPIPEKQKLDVYSLEEGLNALLPENVYLEQIRVAGGEVLLRQWPGGGPVERLKDVDLKIQFLAPQVLGVKGRFRLGTDAYADLTVDGVWRPRAARWRFDFGMRSSRVPPWVLEFQKKKKFRLQKGRLMLTGRAEGTPDRRMAFDIKSLLDAAEFTWGPARLEARGQIEAHGEFDFVSRSFTRYAGRMTLARGKLVNASPDLTLVEDLKGRIRFEPDLLAIEGVTGRSKGVAFTADGMVSSFKEPRLDIEIRSRLPLEQALTFVPPGHERLLAGWRARGQCEAIASVSGPLNQAPLKKEYSLAVSRAVLKNPSKRLLITDFSAKLRAGDEGVRVSEAGFLKDGVRYRMDLEYPKAAGSAGRLALEAPDWKLDADFTPEGRGAVLQSVRVRGRGVNASFSGRLRDFQEPFLEAKGKCSADLAQWKSPVDPRGEIEATFDFSGLWNDRASWRLAFEASSPLLILRKTWQLPRLEAQGFLEDNRLRITRLSATPYGGRLTLVGTADLAFKPARFDFKAAATRIDLGILGREFNAKEKRTAGVMHLSLNLNGALGRPESYAGSGNVTVTEGWLFESTLFSQMGRLPFVRVEGLDRVIFERANGAFTVGGRKIRFKPLDLSSGTVDLSLTGDIDFDQRLDMIMNVRFSNSVILGAIDTGGLVPFVVQEAESMISQYRVSGTVQEPEYRKGSLV